MSRKEEKQKQLSQSIFVLDTSVIRHDSASIFQYGEDDIVIPMIVINKMESLEKGNSLSSFNARDFSKIIKKYNNNELLDGGALIAPGKGRITIKTNLKTQPALKEVNFSLSTNDFKVLNTVMFVIAREASKQTNRKVILVTKSFSLLLKAKMLNIEAEDYIADYIDNIEELCKEPRTIKEVSIEIINQLHGKNFVSPDVFGGETFFANEFFVLKNGSHSVLATFDANLGFVRKIRVNSCAQIEAQNVEQFFALDALMNENIPVVILTGIAGTGKTLLALASAIEQRSKYQKIKLARPTIGLEGKSEGFLKGDLEEKVAPYMAPFEDNLLTIKHKSTKFSKLISEMKEKNKIELLPLLTIRGRNFLKIFMIIDETQNLTTKEIKAIGTRPAEGTKVVLTGDLFQIDNFLLNIKSAGLSNVISKFRESKMVAHIHLSKCERSQTAELFATL